MKIMITGAAGFIGGFLTKHCLSANCSVLGLGATEPVEWTGGSFELCDVRDAARLSRLISTFQPDRVFHLAAQSYPTVSLERPQETFEINAVGTINLFEGVRKLGRPPIVVVACSSAEYGPVDAVSLPVREDHPLRPLHPYGVSKVAQDLLAAQYFANYQIPCVRIRIFNTTGPGKLGDVCSDFARRAVEIELGLRPALLRIGNLTRRAIIDVRDLVRGLCMVPDCCVPGEVYNLGATRIYPLEDVIAIIRENLSVPFSLATDAALVRNCDEPVIAGDITKFQICSGWNPEIDLQRTLQDIMDWWRTQLAPEQEASESLTSQSD